MLVADPYRNVDPVEHRLCGAFWVWLEAERKARGQEPTPDEKRAHPAFVALMEHRAAVDARRAA